MDLVLDNFYVEQHSYLFQTGTDWLNKHCASFFMKEIMEICCPLIFIFFSFKKYVVAFLRS